MNQVHFRFYEELNNYLPDHMRKAWIESWIESETSVGERLQSIGIPLDDIDLILVNQQSKGFDYILQDGDRVSIYPIFESFDVSAISQVREKPLRNLRFICDVHLGRLCKYLRMMGWDSLYSNQLTPQQIIELSRQEQRVILSRSVQLTRHKNVTHAWLIRSSDPLEQLKDLVTALDLSKWADPLTRCLNCNDKLVQVQKREILQRLQARTAKYYNEFFKCLTCDQIYWKGSHYENMLQFIEPHLQHS